MSVDERNESLDISLLVDLAQDGVAESLTETERDRLHIPTDLDTYLAERVRDRHQVVLTGNPGDGEIYPVLDEVAYQLDKQIVYEDGVNPVLDEYSVTVIDLGNQSVLKPEIIEDCISRIVDLFYDSDQATETHVYWNLRELNQDEIQENLRDFLAFRMNPCWVEVVLLIEGGPGTGFQMNPCLRA